MFKATLSKLEKGWDVSVTVADFDAANELMSDHHEKQTTAGKKFRSGIKKNSDGAYQVTLYQSKLKDGQAFIKEMFLKFRDSSETSVVAQN